MDDIEKWSLTPKGFLAATLLKRGIEMDVSEEIWSELREFCTRSSKRLYNSDKIYAVLVFDSEGGTAIGFERDVKWSGMDLIEIRQYLIGMEFAAASAFAKEHGCKLRPMKVDGKDYVGICNLDVKRINVSIEDGVIIEVTGVG